MLQLTAAVLALFGAASPPPAACAAEPRAAGEVRAVAEGIIAADNARDLARVLASYAPDAVLLPPGEGPVIGAAAIRPRYEALFAGFDPAIEGHIDELCVDGAAAFVRGRNRGRLAARGAGPSRELDDVYVMRLRRGKDSAWRISHLMWHRASPPAAR
jgi:uncharacterized protein (TIGR02246 family)